jgi:uncharacterized protein
MHATGTDGDVVIEVSVVFALAPPALPLMDTVQLRTGATVADALRATATLVDIYREQVTDMHMGIFGERCDMATQLKHGDRIELLRPLQLSPTEQRRERQARNSAVRDS